MKSTFCPSVAYLCNLLMLFVVFYVIQSVRSRECVEERRCDKKSTKTNDNIHGPSPSNVEEPASEKNLVLEPLPFQLRRRSTRKKSVAETSTSDVEVVEGDEGDADSDVKSSKNANPAPLAKRKTAVKMVDAAQTVLLDVAKSVAETSAETGTGFLPPYFYEKHIKYHCASMDFL